MGPSAAICRAGQGKLRKVAKTCQNNMAKSIFGKNVRIHAIFSSENTKPHIVDMHRQNETIYLKQRTCPSFHVPRNGALKILSMQCYVCQTAVNARAPSQFTSNSFVLYSRLLHNQLQQNGSTYMTLADRILHGCRLGNLTASCAIQGKGTLGSCNSGYQKIKC